MATSLSEVLVCGHKGEIFHERMGFPIERKKRNLQRLLNGYKAMAETRRRRVSERGLWELRDERSGACIGHPLLGDVSSLPITHIPILRGGLEKD
ncbi:MAG: hypothetical protein ACE5OY_04265 [Candidatus Bathyarchaeia archaeon]